MRRNDKDKETIKAIEVDEAIRQQFTRDPKAEAIKVSWGQTHPIHFLDPRAILTTFFRR